MVIFVHNKIIRLLEGPIASETIRTSAVFGLRLLVQAATLLLVAKVLGSKNFGAFAGLSALALILGTIASLGVQLVLVREMSRNPKTRNKILAYAIPTTLVSASILLIAYLAVGTSAFNGPTFSFGTLFAIGASEILLSPLLHFCVCEHLALGRTAKSQLLSTLPLGLRLSVAAAIFIHEPAEPLTLYAYGYLITSFISLLAGLSTILKPWPPTGSWRLAKRKELWDSASYAALNVTTLAPGELDKALAVKLLPLGSAGLYAASARVLGAVTLPVIAMTLSALPRLFREKNSPATQNKNLLRWILTAALVYGILLSILLYICAPILSWLLGAEYNGIEQVMRWLLLAAPAMALRFATGNILMTLHSPWLRAGFELTGPTCLVFSTVLLVPEYGLSGMAFSMVFSEWIMATTSLFLVAKATKKHSTYFPPS